MTLTARWCGCAAVTGLLLVVAAAPSLAHAASVELTVIADDICADSLRDVLQEQLADVAADVAWSCRQGLDKEEPFRSGAATADRVRLWLDVSRPSEARLAVRDDRSDRFVVRRIPLAGGLDEVGREQLGQIVRWSVLAVLSGPRETLSRSEARAAVSSWPDKSRESPPARNARRSPVSIRTAPPPPRERAPWAGFVDLGAAATARAFSRAVPAAEEIGISLAFGGSSPWALWIQADYRFPATYLSSPVGVELRDLALRGGLLASSDRRARFSFRAGAGGGVERASFSPRPADGAVDLAPGGSFVVVTARALLGMQWRATAHVLAGLTLFCDLQTSDVHYDLHEPDGSIRRVLVPFAFQPGVMITVLGRLGS